MFLKGNTVTRKSFLSKILSSAQPTRGFGSARGALQAFNRASEATQAADAAMADIAFNGAQYQPLQA